MSPYFPVDVASLSRKRYLPAFALDANGLQKVPMNKQKQPFAVTL